MKGQTKKQQPQVLIPAVPADRWLPSEVYAALQRTVLYAQSKEQQLGGSLAERLVQLGVLRKCFHVTSTDDLQVLRYALQHNAYLLPCYKERASALAAARDHRHKVQLVGADAYLVPQRSEFYSLFSGAEAWRTAEVAELQRLIQGYKGVPTYGGHLEVEVLDVDIALHARPSGGLKGCFSCFSGDSSGKERDYYVALALRSNNDSSGSGQPQPQRTHGLPGTPGSKVSFKCHTEPFRIYSEDAQLRVQLKSAHLGSGNTTSSGDHVVGQVHVPMACLEAPAKDAPCSPHTIVAPVYSHAALGSSLHSHHGEEGDETGGRASFDPSTKQAHGTQGREVRGFVRLKYRLVVERRQYPASDQAVPSPMSNTNTTHGGRLSQNGGHQHTSAKKRGDQQQEGGEGHTLLKLDSTIPDLPELPYVASLHTGANSGGGAGNETDDDEDAMVRPLPRHRHGAAASWGGGGGSTKSQQAAADALAGGKVVKELTSLENSDLSPALRFAMAYINVVWQLWQQGALDDVPGAGDAEHDRASAGGHAHAKGLQAGRGQGQRRMWVGVQPSKASKAAAQEAAAVPKRNAIQGAAGNFLDDSHHGMGFNGHSRPGSAVSLHATATVTSKSGNGRPAAKSYSGTNSNGKAPAADVEEAEGVVEGRALLQAAGMQQLTDSLAVLYNMQVPGSSTAQKSQQQRAFAVPSATPAVEESEPVPGGLYWRLLMTAAEMYRLRGPAVRLCILAHILDAWRPGSKTSGSFYVLETCLRAMAPLAALEEARLLTAAESKLYALVSGAFLQRATDILERHYELYESPDLAIACLSAAHTVVQLVVGLSSGPEVVGKLVRIHLGTAVERRMRALLHADRAGLAASLAALERRHGAGAPQEQGKSSKGIKGIRTTSDGDNSSSSSLRSPRAPLPGSPEKLEALCRQQEFADVSQELVGWVTGLMATAAAAASAQDSKFLAAGPTHGTPLPKRTSPATQEVAAAALAASVMSGDAVVPGGALDVTPLIVACAVMMDDTQADLLVQPVFSECLDLPRFTTHIRYKLLVDALKRQFNSAGGGAVTYSQAVSLLEGKLHELHALLLESGLGAYNPAVLAENQALLQPLASAAEAAVKAKGRGSRKGSVAEAAPATHASNALARAGTPQQLPASVSHLYSSTPPLSNRSLQTGSAAVVTGPGARVAVAACEASTTSRVASQGSRQQAKRQGSAQAPAEDEGGNSTALGPVELVDITALLGPSVEQLIKGVGRRLLDWVDKTVEAELTSSEPTSSKPSSTAHTPTRPSPGGGKVNGTGLHSSAHQAASGPSGSGWRAVSYTGHVLHSFSVIDLYHHLHNAAEAVARRVMGHGSLIQSAHCGRLLHGAIAAAVRRYISHVEQHSLHQLSAASPGAGGNSTAAGGGRASTSGAAGGASAPGHKRGLSNSVPLGIGVTLAPPVAVGDSSGHSGDPSRHTLPGTTGGTTVITPELCVLLCNMAEVVAQQTKLEAMLLAAVKGDLRVLAEAAVTSPRAHHIRAALYSSATAARTGTAKSAQGEQTRHAANAKSSPPHWKGGSTHPGGLNKKQGKGSSDNDSDSDGGSDADTGSQGGAGDSDSGSISEVSIGDLALQLEQGAQDPVEALVFGSPWERLSTVVMRSMTSIMTHAGTRLQTRLDVLLASQGVGASGNKPGAAQGQEFEVLAGAIDSELQVMHTHLTPKLARRMVLVVWDSVLGGFRALVIGQAQGHPASSGSSSTSAAAAAAQAPALAGHWGRAAHMLQGLMDLLADQDETPPANHSSSRNAAAKGSPALGEGLGVPRSILASRAAGVKQVLSLAALPTDQLIARYHALVTAKGAAVSGGKRAGANHSDRGSAMRASTSLPDLHSSQQAGRGAGNRLSQAQVSRAPLQKHNTRLQQDDDDDNDDDEDVAQRRYNSRQAGPGPGSGRGQTNGASTMGSNRSTSQLRRPPTTGKHTTAHSTHGSTRDIDDDDDEEEEEEEEEEVAAGGEGHLSAARPAGPLDVIRLLQGRAAAGDKAASAFWPSQARKVAGDGSAMQAIWGLGPDERVLVVATCKLGGCERPGTALLSTRHLAFTTLLEDGKVAAEAAESAVTRMKAALWGGNIPPGYEPDATLLLPLSSIERMDQTFYKGGEALAITLSARTSYLLHAFQPGCAPELVTQVRLHVMGAGMALDRCLRGLEGAGGAGPLALNLPPGEALIRSYPVTRYGLVSDTPGTLYLCTTRMVFDTEDVRIILRYSDISGLRREKDWRGAHWVAVTSPLLPDGKPLWLGVGSSEALAVELLSAISAQGR